MLALAAPTVRPSPGTGRCGPNVPPPSVVVTTNVEPIPERTLHSIVIEPSSATAIRVPSLSTPCFVPHGSGRVVHVAPSSDEVSSCAWALTPPA